MALSYELVSLFAKITKDPKVENREETLYGTVAEYDGVNYVKLDGSDVLTPVSKTADIKPGERVIVRIKDHSATVTGNISSPAARTDDVIELGTKISEFEIIIADKVDTKDFTAVRGDISKLQADNVIIRQGLTAHDADITNLKADNATIKGDISANTADIKKLDTEKLSAKDIEGKYANIDFSNISKATMESFYANSGLIQNVVIGDGTITGMLVGVTIKGELIQGGTVVADKLVIKGTDGIYYKLNTDGVKTEGEQTEYNSLNGQVITANTITASKINVDDLVAFDATIGGFKIGNDAIYSGVKASIDNSTRGLYFGSDGQISIGDSDSYIKYFKDSEGNYKLDISAKTITFGSGDKNVEDAINDIQGKVDTLKDEITTVLYIESSRGTVFKKDSLPTVLSAVIYHGSQRIVDSATMKAVFGVNAYLQWKWQRLDDESFGIISSSDSRFGADGFTFTLSPKDVDTKITFICELIA